jgi:hypothetical protein
MSLWKTELIRWEMSLRLEEAWLGLSAFSEAFGVHGLKSWHGWADGLLGVSTD